MKKAILFFAVAFLVFFLSGLLTSCISAEPTFCPSYGHGKVGHNPHSYNSRR